jgi:hypothetical protein
MAPRMGGGATGCTGVAGGATLIGMRDGGAPARFGIGMGGAAAGIDGVNLDGQERSTCKADIQKTLKTNMGYLENYMDEDDPYAAMADDDIESSKRTGEPPMQPAIPPEKRYKKNPAELQQPLHRHHRWCRRGGQMRDGW